jgi:phage terminase small subunit
MGLLKNVKHEKFAHALASGKTQSDAYRAAGYPEKKSNAATAAVACKLSKHSDVVQRVTEIIERSQFVEDYTTERALQLAEVTKLDIVRELKIIGFSSMQHYTKVTREGNAYVDLSALEENPSLWRAVKDIIVEEYTEGRGEDARNIKRTRVNLHDKRSALIDLAKMHRMISNNKVVIKDSAVQIFLDDADARA